MESFAYKPKNQLERQGERSMTKTLFAWVTVHIFDLQLRAIYPGGLKALIFSFI